MKDPIKVFVGCSPNGEDAESQMVLEYSLRSNTKRNVDIVWMKHSNDKHSFWYGWDSHKWATPFSGFRWGIPSYCKFTGHAIYMDSDMMVLGDIGQLWDQPFIEDSLVISKGGWRFCVMKINCSELKIPILEAKKANFHNSFSTILGNSGWVQKFDRQWNNFDGENDNLSDIKILHYTDMSTQPHLRYAIERLHNNGMKHWYDGPLRNHDRPDVVELFDRLYNGALAAGYSVDSYIDKEKVQYVKASQHDYVAEKI